mmetsp:Transcript_35862/g.101515  ORF Transcript_35862/g.101515 Transcript_35862/m.101515 type:complete len:950 (-) Transcript_35862:353-3202(-)
MLRQGGWAVPLSCDHPAVQLWLSYVVALQQAWCWLAGTQPCILATAKDQCTTFWTPYTLVTTLGLLSCLWVGLCAWLIRKAIRRWYTGTLHIEVAKQAAHSARALQLEQAKKLGIHSTPHQWCKLARSSQHPVLCAICFREVAPNMGEKVNCCEVCGIAVHKLCRHLMPSSCKPVALLGNSNLHHWLPAACVVEDEHSVQDPSIDAQTTLCMYCKEPCIGMLLPVEEPIWQCAWCHQVCHVQCYDRHHTVLKTPKPRAGKKKKKKMGSQSCLELPKAAVPGRASMEGGRAPLGTTSPPKRNGRAPASKKGAALPSITEKDGSSDRVELQRRDSMSLNDSEQRRPSSPMRRNGSHQVLAGEVGLQKAMWGTGTRDDTLLGRHSSSWAGSETTISRRDSGDINGLPGPLNVPPLSEQQEQPPMDVCRLGPASRMVVPPTCVIQDISDDNTLLSPSAVGSESDASSPHPGGSSAKAEHTAALLHDLQAHSWTARAMQAGKEAGRQARQQANGLLEGLYRSGALMASRAVEYKIANLGPMQRPLLIFINTKSGPQVGFGLRRWFLRNFNPIQVVELPREDPLHALRLFSGVSNLRVLVVGGDGSVGWILSCIDLIQKEKDAEGAALPEDGEEDAPRGQSSPRGSWTPPPVGVLPLGTGNDLARCLNWGGGMHAVRESGMSALMSEIQRAAVVLLDRWEVRITQVGDKKEALTTEVKSMNNYLGLGVDAKAALDFHNTREQYPEWFQSQLGNKMWYGVVGATDLIGHSCASLPVCTTLEVDGVVVPLPDDIEGLMLLNITSYMGGVNLWTCGRRQLEEQWDHANHCPFVGGGVQSMSDGIIEVVAVYGTWHLGQLQVGMSSARRLAQGRHVRLTVEGTLPMQIDGEPWMQGPAQLDVSWKGQAFMLRRLNSNSAGIMASIVGEALDTCESKGILSTRQRQAVIAELAARLGPIL